MNYRHIYHAGNFADVIKHLTLIAILQNLGKKEAPYYVLDAFAGIGKYDLSSSASLKTNEAEQGIKKILAYEARIPSLLLDYKTLVTKNHSQENLIYPGSPLIISEFLREKDKADFCELHPEDYLSLKKNLWSYSNSHVHNIDGYLSLKSLLPPEQKRGMILIDPPFEVVDEFARIINGLEVIYKKFSQATTLIWYPIKDYKQVKEFYKNLLLLNKEILKVEFSLSEGSASLKSTGLIIINPPYIQDLLIENLEFLGENIFKGQSKGLVSKLT